jgi:hypothetical protein
MTGIQFLAGAEFFLCHHIQTGCGTHPTFWPVALSLGVKCLEHEANHSLPSSFEVKNAWNFAFTPPVHLLDVVLRHRNPGYLLPLG